MVNGPPEPAPNARLCLLTSLLFTQLCRKVHKSLATSQRSSATHSLWESEHRSTSRKDSGLLSRTCFIFYSQAMNTRNHPISVLVTPFFLKDLENKRPTPHNPADFGKKKRKKSNPRNGALWNTAPWTSRPEPSSKLRVPWIRTLLSDRSSHSQGTNTRTCQGRSPASAAHGIHGQVLGPCALWPSRFAGSLLMQRTSLLPSQENARLTVSLKQEGTGGRNPERSCKGKP